MLNIGPTLYIARTTCAPWKDNVNFLVEVKNNRKTHAASWLSLYFFCFWSGIVRERPKRDDDN